MRTLYHVLEELLLGGSTGTDTMPKLGSRNYLFRHDGDVRCANEQFHLFASSYEITPR